MIRAILILIAVLASFTGLVNTSIRSFQLSSLAWNIATACLWLDYLIQLFKERRIK